jgi:prepilin signal peptidase PulO-like enzyme (type II secretory pathway)
MKTKRFFGMDERNTEIGLRVIAVMYFLTIIALQGVILYRQFVLDQNIQDFEDLAVILTVNSLFLISALVFFGAIPIQQLKIRSVLLAYAGIVVLGSLFTYFKYNVFQQANLTMAQILDKISIVSAVSGLIVVFFVIFSLLGRRKMQKELE